MLHVEIKRTVCEKRDHSSLDSCHFQKKKNLQQVCVQFIWGAKGTAGDSWPPLAVQSLLDQLCHVFLSVQASPLQSQLGASSCPGVEPGTSTRPIFLSD